VRATCTTAAFAILIGGSAQAATPVHGHYPPGQTGLRGAASPAPGWSITDFNRLFSNLDTIDAGGNSVGHPNEARYANIAMVGWTSEDKIFDMSYGAIVGVPFATGNLNPADDEVGSSSFNLGDIIVTPLSLSGEAGEFDYQFQLSVWTPSGHFKPGDPANRGSGFWSVIPSIGGVWYPGGDRKDWSISAMWRLEQNFEQAHTGITPGDNLDLDWGVGKVIRLGPYTFDAGVSGFATWQVTTQSGGSSVGRYHYYGAGPEISASLGDGWGARIRAQWEFSTENAVQGNNLWLIASKRF
jgi:hypothetical protein